MAAVQPKAGGRDWLPTGPGTITEAINAGLPMVLYSRLPGQEDGNPNNHEYCNGSDLWAKDPVPDVFRANL